jgi:hypothetical protein
VLTATTLRAYTHSVLTPAGFLPEIFLIEGFLPERFLIEQPLRFTVLRPEGSSMQPANTMVRSFSDNRRDAIAWLVDRLRWERTLDRLRSTEEGRTEQAA